MHANYQNENLPSMCICSGSTDDITYKKSPGVNMLYCVGGSTDCGPGARFELVSSSPLTRKCIGCIDNCKLNLPSHQEI